MTPTDRDLIQRLADELDRYKQILMDDRRKTHPLATEARAYLDRPKPERQPSFAELLMPARAYLAQPEPEGPTDDELFDVAESYVEDNCLLGLHNLPDFARAVLARWGTR